MQIYHFLIILLVVVGAMMIQRIYIAGGGFHTPNYPTAYDVKMAQQQAAEFADYAREVYSKWIKSQ